MKYYRLYCFDGASRVLAVLEIDALSDAEAIQSVGAVGEYTRAELWEQDRLVARFQRSENSN
jgi:hypothetical protein